jgi:hypothetical protein
MSAALALPLFLLFFPKFTASSLPFLAEILGRGGFDA